MDCFVPLVQLAAMSGELQRRGDQETPNREGPPQYPLLSAEVLKAKSWHGIQYQQVTNPQSSPTALSRVRSKWLLGCPCLSSALQTCSHLLRLWSCFQSPTKLPVL